MLAGRLNPFRERMNITVDLNEGRYLDLGCCACREDVQSRISMTSRLYVVALCCEECGEELVRFDAMSGRAA